MKNTANAAPCRHRKLRPELRYDTDLFDVALEQEHLQSEAVRRIARRFGLPVSLASVVAFEAGIVGAQYD
jgi:hypothetical protein